MPASWLLFSRSALIDLLLALLSCSHCSLLILWRCSCLLGFLHCLLVKYIPAYFLPFCLSLLLLLSPSLFPALFLEDSLILLCLGYYFPTLKHSPDPQPAAPWPRCCFPSQLSGAAVKLSSRHSSLVRKQLLVLQLEELHRSCSLVWKPPMG